MPRNNFYTPFKMGNYKKYKDWREKVFNLFDNKCANCGNTTKLESHHIIPITESKETAFEIWNGVCLCRKCHQKTDSWGAKKKEKKVGKRIISIITVPHNWQEYETVGNWKITKSGKIIIFISELSTDEEFLIAIHELIEAKLCLKKGIKEPDIAKFDKMFEKERLSGLHSKEDEPGNDPRAPYKNEHYFAESIEYRIADILGVKWSEYSDHCNALDKLK